REQGDRHRQLLRRLDEVQDDDGMEADGCAGGRSASHDCVLPRALVRVRGPRQPRGAAVTGRIPFLSLVPREDDDARDVHAAIDRVVARGWFILGPEVEAFEQEFAAASGATHAVAVGNGTDAIALILRALGIGRGDEVITTPLSAAYSALAILMAGARPVFVDVDPHRLPIDPARIAAAVGPCTRAILPVHLYGQPADMRAIEGVASAHDLAIVEDCCQAHLATSDGRPVGTIGV